MNVGLFFFFFAFHFLYTSYIHASFPVHTCHAVQEGLHRLPSLLDILAEGQQLVFPHLLMSPCPLLLHPADLCLDELVATVFLSLVECIYDLRKRIKHLFFCMSEAYRLSLFIFLSND